MNLLKKIIFQKNKLLYIINHPLNSSGRLYAIWRYLNWHLNIKYKKNPVLPFMENTKLIATKNDSQALNNYLTGLDEFEDMCFLLHLLDQGDSFVDIGANIGAYSILASKLKGAYSHSFEPNPKTYSQFLANISLNNLDRQVFSYQIGLGKEKSEVSFIDSLGTESHVLSKDESVTNKHKISIMIEKADVILKEINPVLLKIDVEGFESDVLAGAQNILKNNKLKAIIIELNESGKRYGKNDNDIHNLILSYDFLPFRYDPFKRELTELKTYNKGHNTLYIKDITFTTERIQKSPKVKIFNNSF